MLLKNHLVKKKGAKDFLWFISLGRVNIAPGEAEEKVVLFWLLAV
jgi:hypothetical protein